MIFLATDGGGTAGPERKNEGGFVGLYLRQERIEERFY
jgi:hypothetical protein